MAAPNSNFSELASTTLRNYQAKLVDNIHNSNAVLMLLKQKQRIVDGGTKATAPLVYSENETAGSYSGFDELDTSHQEMFTTAEFEWKQYSAQIAVSGEERMKNSGESAFINHLEAKLSAAEISLASDLTIGLFGDGSDSKDIVGLDSAVLASGTYGGINGTTHTWWRAYVESTAESLTLGKMRTAYNSTSKGGTNTPDTIATSQTLFEAYENLVSSNHQIFTEGKTNNGKLLGDAGFNYLEFKGAPVVYDEQCTADKMYFLNSKHLYFKVMGQRNFSVTDFIPSTKQDAEVAMIQWMGALVCDRRASQGVLSGKTA